MASTYVCNLRRRFDIKEFAVHDGPGIRTTVFLKGCSLACQWCHNPEGQSRLPQVMRSPTGERTAGQVYTAPELARLLNQQAAILKAAEGGVTFSGGEPLFQARFVSQVIDLLDGVHIRGPLSELQSFARIDYRRICNGGPITMELSDTVFRDAEALRKVALLVRTFAQLGCQQLQLNSLDLETLLDAKAHPEQHPSLIVRVWGWSDYFCELSPEYQNHRF